MNTINLEAVHAYHREVEKALRARHGTRGEHTQALLDAVNLGVEMAFLTASAAISIAYDVRAIRTSLAPPRQRLTGLSNKSEPPT